MSILGIWNFARFLLIAICCYQIGLALLDAQQANRMLQIAEGPAEYRAGQAPLDHSSVIEVLNRRSQSAWGCLVGLGLLALLSYAPSVKKRRKEESKMPNKRMQPARPSN